MGFLSGLLLLGLSAGIDKMQNIDSHNSYRKMIQDDIDRWERANKQMKETCTPEEYERWKRIHPKPKDILGLS